ncbi:MAG: DUF456 domain-containing protein [Akkermansia sp.]|nr:DUF456 domain-containing protein [Akkermansia sp.]
MWDIILYTVAVILCAVGLVGCVLPFPGHLFVLGACVCASIAHGEPHPAWWMWAIMAVLVALGMTVDTLCSMAGAKKFGGTKAAMFGVIPGVIVGAFFAPIGLFVGPFLGAFLAEVIIMRRELGKSTVSGVGATLGYIAGALSRSAVAIVMLLFYFIFMW